tara:strand:- start:95 stop:316 length:222 start_codon:yes stop_codon:yes gene_type:complete
MNKFKIGDLVTMSAAGQARDQNYSVLGRTGIVMGYEADVTWPILVHWLPIPPRFPTTNFKEYELKFVSKARRA